MRIKIKSNPVGQADRESHRNMAAVAGRWIPAEIDYLYHNYKADIPGVPDTMRVHESNVEAVDYEGDAHLKAIHGLMRSGQIRWRRV